MGAAAPLDPPLPPRTAQYYHLYPFYAGPIAQCVEQINRLPADLQDMPDNSKKRFQVSKFQETFKDTFI